MFDFAKMTATDPQSFVSGKGCTGKWSRKGPPTCGQGEYRSKGESVTGKARDSLAENLGSGRRGKGDREKNHFGKKKVDVLGRFCTLAARCNGGGR